MSQTVQIYTDGACSGNPGPGGWAAILQANGHEKVISGNEVQTTNNRMELTAALEALRQLKRACRIELFSDSAYLVSAFTQGWLDNWQRRGWKMPPAIRSATRICGGSCLNWPHRIRSAGSRSRGMRIMN